MVDSGAAVSVCPLGYALEIPIVSSSRNATLRTASGAQIEHAGQKMIQYEHDEGRPVSVNFEVADATRPLVPVGELQRRGMTVVMGPHGSCVTRGRAAKPSGGSLEHERSNVAHRMRRTRGENGSKVLAPIEVQRTPMLVTKVTSELPSVEDTIGTTREDAEAQIPTVVSMPYRCWCFSCVPGRGADDPHRTASGYTGPPRVECDFMFLTSRALVESWTDHIQHGRPRGPGSGARSLLESRK